ncbi:MAG: SDR family oxidoreductase [Candidatus Eisenbacteria bacterium]|uniref:SDR family oxidoreductase n=1 Tax=Eiseniibacteriota bacterium TaxID=2212470 RepID=A0A948RY27_UNCEI|nr:SDR family oxidoreductase [Candidatus Eisenbacteria bacterium]MBU1947522.1 SDR family oxidoreductase [Candidatus Eisenbacteria bacterium]MBU2691678.1 SDR family oxidoreductase [Candidatus Eisenbacteria bacterium]
MLVHLITGGAGFIGSHIADRLAGEGKPVRILDNFSTGRRETISYLRDRHGAGIEVIEGDIRDGEICKAAMRGCDVVFHEAALPSVERSVQDPLASHAVNATGTLNLLVAARDSGVRRFLFAGSSSVYGDAPCLPKVEDQTPLPRSPYALSKLASEEYVRIFSELYGLSTLTLRYFNVFGPRQDPNSAYAAVIPRFITALDNNEPPVIYGDGEQSRDFTYIDNVVDANLMAAERLDVTGVMNIACGEQSSLLELLAMLAEIQNKSIAPNFEPERAGDVKHSRADVTRARERLNYTPRLSLKEGLALTVASYIKA